MTVMAGGPGARLPGYLGRVLDQAGDPVGTCFQVVPGILVTAWHVLNDIAAAAVGMRVDVDPLAGGHSFAVSVVRLDQVHDLAVLASETHLSESAGALVATDTVPLRARVVVTGHVSLNDPGYRYRYFDAPGRWAGAVVRDDESQGVPDVLLGRMTAEAISRGMSGAPVVCERDGFVAGVVTGRYNSADGWLAGTAWVSRTEDLRDLLAWRRSTYGPPLPTTMRQGRLRLVRGPVFRLTTCPPSRRSSSARATWRTGGRSSARWPSSLAVRRGTS